MRPTDADGFIADDLLDESREAQLKTAADNQRLDRFRREEEEMSAEALAEELRQRHARSSRYASQSDYAEVPQRLLMPSVDDPGLWRIRCKRGRERHLVSTVLRRALMREAAGKPLRIFSAFTRDSLEGQIFVEARRADDVTDAFEGLAGAYTNTKPFLVPILEMADLLKLQKKNTEVPVGGWVRIKRGKYAGDLAQVLDVAENGEEVGVKLVPRIDLAPSERDTYTDRAGRKRKKPVNAALTALGFRPPQRLFNAEDVQKAYHELPTRRGGVWVFGGETYRDGYLEKDFRISALQIDDVNPSLDEVLRFTGDSSAEKAGVDLNLLADASKRGLEATLQPGDHVEVFEGEQAGVAGVVEALEGDVVTLELPDGALEGQKIEVPARCVRKQFRPGDHIKVLAGKHADETGLVVKVEDGVTTFLSDLSLREVSVFSKDIREAAEVGSGVNVIGGYELHNLVQLDAQTVGVIFKIERESFRVLDQNGHVVAVKPHQISMRRDTARAVALDHNGHEVKVGDMVKEVEWQLSQFRQGQVLHIFHSSLLFIHNRDYSENGGLFIARANNVEPLAPTSVRQRTDTTRLNPALKALDADGGANAAAPRRGGRDIFAGKHVAIVRGPYKTYRGIIKETTGGVARVELHTMSKILTVPLDHMVEKKCVSCAARLTQSHDGREPPPRGPRPGRRRAAAHAEPVLGCGGDPGVHRRRHDACVRWAHAGDWHDAEPVRRAHAGDWHDAKPVRRDAEPVRSTDTRCWRDAKSVRRYAEPVWRDAKSVRCDAESVWRTDARVRRLRDPCVRWRCDACLCRCGDACVRRRGAKPVGRSARGASAARAHGRHAHAARARRTGRLVPARGIRQRDGTPDFAQPSRVQGRAGRRHAAQRRARWLRRAAASDGRRRRMHRDAGRLARFTCHGGVHRRKPLPLQHGRRGVA